MAYSYYASITVDNTKVSGSSNLTNFPILVSGTYDGTGGEPDIRTSANGGNVENTASGGASGSYTVPADLVFSPNTDGSSPYDFEIEYYNASTGAIRAWVEIPSLDYDDDTVIYMVYGDSGVTTSQEDVNGTWSSVFEGVFHFSDNVKESSGQNDVFSAVNSPSYVDSSACGRAIDLNGTTQYVLTTNDGVLQPGQGDGIYTETVLKLDDKTSNQTLLSCRTESNPNMLIIAANITNDKVGHNTDNDAWILSDSNLDNTAYRHLTTSFDGSSEVFFRLDGVADGDPAEDTFDSEQASARTAIGANDRTDQYGDISAYLNGQIAEFRIAHSHLGADWSLTSYNTIMDSSNFYTMGSEQGGGAPPATAVPQMALTGVGL